MLKILQTIDHLLKERKYILRLSCSFIAASMLVAVATVLRAALLFHILPYLFFLLAILPASLIFGIECGLIAVALSALSAVYYFLPPDNSFVIQNFEQGLSVFVFIIVSAIIASICSFLRSTLLGQERKIQSEVAIRTKAEDALRQSQKMEAVGQLTGGLAHDFNNGLLAISGSLELIRLNVGRQRYDKLSRFLDTAEHATKSAADLTARLLAFSRRANLEPQAIDACALVSDFAMVLSRTLPTVEIKIECDGSWLVSADPGQLENALLKPLY